MRSINKAKILSALFIVIFVSILIGISYVSISSKIAEVQSKWPAIEFAMQEPEIVLATKNQFASDSAEMKKKYMNKQQTEQDKLIEQLTKQLESK